MTKYIHRISNKKIIVVFAMNLAIHQPFFDAKTEHVTEIIPQSSLLNWDKINIAFYHFFVKKNKPITLLDMKTMIDFCQLLKPIYFVDQTVCDGRITLTIEKKQSCVKEYILDITAYDNVLFVHAKTDQFEYTQCQREKNIIEVTTTSFINMNKIYDVNASEYKFIKIKQILPSENLSPMIDSIKEILKANNYDTDIMDLSNCVEFSYDRKNVFYSNDRKLAYNIMFRLRNYGIVESKDCVDPDLIVREKEFNTTTIALGRNDGMFCLLRNTSWHKKKKLSFQKRLFCEFICVDDSAITDLINLSTGPINNVTEQDAKTCKILWSRIKIIDYHGRTRRGYSCAPKWYRKQIFSKSSSTLLFDGICAQDISFSIFRLNYDIKYKTPYVPEDHCQHTSKHDCCNDSMSSDEECRHCDNNESRSDTDSSYESSSGSDYHEPLPPPRRHIGSSSSESDTEYLEPDTLEYPYIDVIPNFESDNSVKFVPDYKINRNNKYCVKIIKNVLSTINKDDTIPLPHTAYLIKPSLISQKKKSGKISGEQMYWDMLEIGMINDYYGRCGMAQKGTDNVTMSEYIVNEFHQLNIDPFKPDYITTKWIFNNSYDTAIKEINLEYRDINKIIDYSALENFDIKNNMVFKTEEFSNYEHVIKKRKICFNITSVSDSKNILIKNLELPMGKYTISWYITVFTNTSNGYDLSYQHLTVTKKLLNEDKNIIYLATINIDLSQNDVVPNFNISINKTGIYPKHDIQTCVNVFYHDADDLHGRLNYFQKKIIKLIKNKIMMKIVQYYGSNDPKIHSFTKEYCQMARVQYPINENPTKKSSKPPKDFDFFYDNVIPHEQYFYKIDYDRFVRRHGTSSSKANATVTKMDANKQVHGIDQYAFSNNGHISTGRFIDNSGRLIVKALTEKEKLQGRIGYKAAKTTDGGMCIITLFIPADAKVAWHRDPKYSDQDKFRASKIIPIKIERVYYNGNKYYMASELEKPECPICYDKISNIRTIPCNHKACVNCANNLKGRVAKGNIFACWICRQAITEIVNIPSVSDVNSEELNTAYSCVHVDEFEYRLNEEITIKEFDPNLNQLCKPGIHYCDAVPKIFQYFEYVTAPKDVYQNIMPWKDNLPKVQYAFNNLHYKPPEILDDPTIEKITKYELTTLKNDSVIEEPATLKNNPTIERPTKMANKNCESSNIPVNPTIDKPIKMANKHSNETVLLSMNNVANLISTTDFNKMMDDLPQIPQNDTIPKETKPKIKEMI